ncbi:cytochrome b-c1 complex subunit 7 [Apiosordaria backusii]|uniref:Complex III subunit 7 n=1 Tax=Apiosordaria backusii TaxID=314023 RepID=A0AA40A3X3_9PEZI|nr:cytochrome b-c1 complex subunit 7 [Apiosordaria backusii]
MTAPSLAGYVAKRPWLLKLLQPVANWYANAALYRQMGLRKPRRPQGPRPPPPKDSYDRIYRIRRAIQLSIQQKILPKNEWTKPEEDVPYLSPILQAIEAEAKEKEALDTLVPAKGSH